ncbi:MAG: anaerobic sulfatase maturase [Opitutales bacterium]
MASASQTASAPFHLMTKPIGPICNLECTYCFYLEKEQLFEKNERWRMSDDTLERYVKAYIQAQPGDEVNFAWQGGEPTLLGVDFFRKAVAWQKQYAGGKRISNAFQTNGTLLNEEWAQFLADAQFLVGISIDGPPELHNTYRVDKRGQDSYAKVMRGLECLKRHKVEFNTLTVVNRANSQHPLEVYKFLRNIGSTYLQFIPLVERQADVVAHKLGLDLAAPPDLDHARQLDGSTEGEAPKVTEWSVRPHDYGEFLIRIFDRWVTRDVGRTYVQQFDTALAKWLGVPGGVCHFSETCGRALAIEHDGNVYACDHFVYPHYRLGNFLEDDLAAMADSPQMRKFGEDKRDTLPRYCRECTYLFACNGECPKHRFETTPDGEPGLNYLCAAYKRFFAHIDPALRVMAQLYRQGQPPAAIMTLLKRDKLLLQRARSQTG